jgi:hypothetical protein
MVIAFAPNDAKTPNVAASAAILSDPSIFVFTPLTNGSLDFRRFRRPIRVLFSKIHATRISRQENQRLARHEAATSGPASAHHVRNSDMP